MAPESIFKQMVPLAGLGTAAVGADTQTYTPRAHTIHTDTHIQIYTQTWRRSHRLIIPPGTHYTHMFKYTDTQTHTTQDVYHRYMHTHRHTYQGASLPICLLGECTAHTRECTPCTHTWTHTGTLQGTPPTNIHGLRYTHTHIFQGTPPHTYRDSCTHGDIQIHTEAHTALPWKDTPWTREGAHVDQYCTCHCRPSPQLHRAG